MGILPVGICTSILVIHGHRFTGIRLHGYGSGLIIKCVQLKSACMLDGSNLCYLSIWLGGHSAQQLAPHRCTKDLNEPSMTDSILCEDLFRILVRNKTVRQSFTHVAPNGQGIAVGIKRSRGSTPDRFMSHNDSWQVASDRKKIHKLGDKERRSCALHLES